MLIATPQVPSLISSADDSHALLEAQASPAHAHLNADTGDLLVVSPYPSRPHLLDLTTLDQPQRILAKALTVLEPVLDDYATALYIEAFNWGAVVKTLRDLVREQRYAWKGLHFYLVVFRSQVPPTTDRKHLGKLDQDSHAEATESGGLLKYWFGLPDNNGRNLATCVWRNHEDARVASTLLAHKAAVRATRHMYSEWKMERLRLAIGDDVESWSIKPWEDRDNRD